MDRTQGVLEHGVVGEHRRRNVQESDIMWGGMCLLSCMRCTRGISLIKMSCLMKI